MKISKLFHWLYASVMFLPLLVAPIFAIYSHRHTINDYQIEVEQNKIVDFNQYVPQNARSLSFDNVLIADYQSDNLWIIDGSLSSSRGFWLCNHTNYFTVGHKYYIRATDNLPVNVSVYLFNYAYKSNDGLIVQLDDLLNAYSGCYIDYVENQTTFTGLHFSYNIFDLTQMFGVGNEPSKEQFDIWFPNQNYSYNIGTDILIKDYQTVTYNNTDIGSQFLYALYITTDQYLNFDSFLNMYQVYDWIEFNAFDGNAPLVFNIAWHYMDYWLLVSIFWLCFDVIMYVPLLAHRWLDKASLE